VDCFTAKLRTDIACAGNAQLPFCVFLSSNPLAKFLMAAARFDDHVTLVDCFTAKLRTNIAWAGNAQLPFCVFLSSNPLAKFLMAAARFDDHVAISFQHHVRIMVKIQHRDGREFCGGAAWFRHKLRIQEVNKRLHDGVVCSVHVSAQGEGTLSIAVES
jgi:hypothetical protein